MKAVDGSIECVQFVIGNALIISVQLECSSVFGCEFNDPCVALQFSVWL